MIDEEEEELGYQARMVNQPFWEEASEAWKNGWREADREWSGQDLDFDSLSE